MAGIKRRRAIVLAALIMLVMSTAADASPATGLIGGAVGSGAQQAHAYATNAPYDGEIEGEEYEPLTAVLKLSEEALPEPGACPASITLTNVGDDVIGDVMLLDAEGNVLWGPRDLDLSGSYTWRGTLDIDEDALSAGVVNCSVSYVLAKGDPLYERHITRRVSAAIERASVQPALEFSRSQSMTYAQPGQSVTLTYTVKNTGNIPLTGIKVSDPLFGVVGELDTLAVDEKKTFTQRVTVGTTALTSTPQVSYSFEGSQDIVQKDIASSSIKIAKPSLEVALESDATLVNPGDTVMLRCKLINNGNVGYRKIQLSDQVLGDLGFIDDLRAGKDTVYAKAVRIQSKTTFKFTITASDTTGSDVTAVSNSLTIDVVSRADEESLTLSAQPDRTSVASGDTVNFTLLLCNGGTTDISGIDISERTRGPIAHVDVLRAGESLTVNAQYTVTGYEMFTFSATMTQQDGATREALAGPITISLGAPAPTSVPTAQPSPTPAATMAPSVMRAYDAAFSRVLAILLAIAVSIAIMLIVVLCVNRSRYRGKGGARGRNGRRRHERNAAPPQAPDEDDDVKVYIPARTLKQERQAALDGTSPWMKPQQGKPTAPHGSASEVRQRPAGSKPNDARRRNQPGMQHPSDQPSGRSDRPRQPSGKPASGSAQPRSGKRIR